MHLLEVNNPVAVQRGVLTAIGASNRPDSLDDKTVGLIWSGTRGGDIALKRAGEKSDDETLRRILEHAKSDMKSRLRAFEAAEQDTSSTN